MTRSIVSTLLSVIVGIPLVGQFTLPKRGGVPGGSGACTGLPAYAVQFLASTLSSGAISTWNDSSGNGHTMTVSGSPTAGLADATPNNTKTVVLTGTQFGTITSGISPGSTIAICAVYKINNLTGKNTLTSNSLSAGAYAYFVNAISGGVAGIDKSNIANIANATTTPTTTWVDSCISYSQSTFAVFYRNGSVDVTSSADLTNGGSQSINQFFQNQGGTEVMKATIAEVDIVNGSINSTQAAAIHNCAVSTYGVP